MMWPFGWIGLILLGCISFAFGFVIGLPFAFIGIFSLFVFPPSSPSLALEKVNRFENDHAVTSETRQYDIRQLEYNGPAGHSIKFNQASVRIDKISKWER